SAPPSGIARHAGQFLPGTHALGHPALPVFTQAAHSVAPRGLAQTLLVCAGVHHAAGFIVDGKELVDAGAALITGVAAMVATRRVEAGGPVFMDDLAHR